VPTIYSFLTTLGYPATEDWPCLYLGEGNMPNVLLIPGVTSTRGTPWFQADADDDMNVMSNDGGASSMTIPLLVGQTFTFETTFRPIVLPTNLNDLNSQRLFIAMFDEQDNAGGVLLSKSGLAIVSSFGNTVLPIAGSQNIILEGTDYYTLRMVVDGKNNVMDLYVTLTDDVAVSGHVLRYTTAAPITPATRADSVRIEVVGQPSNPVQINFSTFRCNCNSLLIPNKRPIADTGADQTAVLGSIVATDGTNSFDPEGEPLSYLWSLLEAPTGSSHRLDGEAGTTIDDGDGDGFTTILEQTGDPWSEENAPSLQPGDVLVVGNVQYVVSDLDWVYDAPTNTYTRVGGFDGSKLRVVEDSVPDNMTGVSWTVYFQSTFWNDRTSPLPSCIPDTVGLYTTQLVVNDGLLDSLPAEGLINISESNVPYGCVPDVNFIWDYLSDAWDLYDDRDPITTIWSGFAQVASNILLTAWQYDYSKSLVDVQRLFQRRWLNYQTKVTEDALDREDQGIKFYRGPIVSKDLTAGVTFVGTETLILSRDGGSDVTVSLTGTMSVDEIVVAINAVLGESSATVKTARKATASAVDYLVLSYPTLIVVCKDGTANATLGFSTTEDTQNNFSGDLGVRDPSIATAFGVADPLISFSGIAKDDLLVFGGYGYRVSKRADETHITTQDSMVIPQVPTLPTWEVSSSVKVPTTDYSTELVVAGDIAMFEVRTSSSDEVVEVPCLVTGANGNVLGFNPRPLYEATLGQLGGFEITLLYVQRVSNIPVDDLVSHIPRLQEIILDPPSVLSRNREYAISVDSSGVNAIRFVSGTYSFDDPPPDYLWAEVTWFDNRPTIENNFGKAVGFTVEDLETRSDDLDYLSAVRGLWYSFFNGPSLWSIQVGTQILLGLPFAEEDGTIEEIHFTYNATQIRVLIRDSKDSTIVRSYFIPRDKKFEEDGESMIAVNPNTGVEYVTGDSIDQFSPLSKGVEILDLIKDPAWWQRYVSSGATLELDKFFKFLMRADIDVFNITNLMFAIDFVKKIKPHYTYPLFVVLKRLAPDLISLTDVVTMKGTKYLFDNPACAQLIFDAGSGGTYRFDDTDESGIFNWAYDGSPNIPAASSGKPEFLYDKKRLGPEMYIVGIMTGPFAGGYFPMDWIWAFDDGGGTDLIPLAGPAPTPPPPPYGPTIGTVVFDTIYSAGYYTRGKVL